jgi:hypothetical protein
MLRQRARNRTEQYKDYQVRYRTSAKRKIYAAAWNERNRERRAALSHVAYLRRKLARGPRLTKCATYGCSGAFVRPKSSHRMFCRECQVVFFGRSYLRSLARRSKTRGQWTRRVA